MALNEMAGLSPHASIAIFTSRRPEWIAATLCAVFLAILWVALWLHLDVDRARTLAVAETENVRLARIFAEHVTRTVRAAVLTLREIESEYRRAGMKFDLQKFVRERRVYLDPYWRLSILDEGGTVVLSSLPASIGMNFKEIDNVRYHREHANAELFISKPRLGAATKKWTIFLSHRIDKADGTHGGNSSVALDPFYFTDFYKELSLSKGSLVSLIGRDAIVRARLIDGEASAGRDLSATALFTHYLRSAPSGSYREASTRDGEKRLYSYRSLPDYPLIVMVSATESAVLMAFEGRRLAYGLAAGTLSLLILLVGAIAVYQIDRHRKLTAQVSADEERFALAIRATNDGIWDWNPVTKYDYFSPRWKEILGYRDDDLANHESSFFNLIHPDDQSIVQEKLARHLENREPYDVEIRMHHKDGSYRWILCRGVALRDHQGNVLRMVGSITDITDRTRSEIELRESEERLRLALYAAGQGLYDLDLTTGDAKVSPEYATMIGYDPATFVETNVKWAERLHPEDRERVYANYLAYVRGDIPSYEVEFRQLTKSGDWLWTLSIGSIVERAPDGKPSRMLGTHTNISARKRAEDLLVERDRQLREAQRLGRMGSWNLDLKNDKLEWSDEIYRIFEIDPRSFAASYEAFLNVVHPDDRLSLDKAYRQSVANRTPYEIEHRLLMKDGRVKLVFERGATDYDAAGQAWRTIGTVQDISGRKAAEEQINRSLAEKEMLLREIHHRVKNNLAVISSLLSLQSRALMAGAGREALIECRDRVLAMALVHEQLYRSADLNAIDFAAHVKDLAANISTSYGRAGRGIELTVDAGAVNLDIDQAIPASLIFNELLSNAFKHGYPDGRGGKVEVSLRRAHAGDLVLRVSDDGVGLPPSLDWQSSPTLGLKLVRNLAEQLHARFEVSSEKGASFQISFAAPDAP